jgi:hypothetical protein
MDGVQEYFEAQLSREFEPRLLQTPLFQECEENEIWGKTPSFEEKFPCRNRSMLVRCLARALVENHWLHRLNKGLPQKKQRDALAAVECLDQILSLMALPTANVRQRERQKIQKAWAIVAPAVRNFPLDYFAQVAPQVEAEVSMHLFNTLWHTFVEHGPSSRKYSPRARYHAIATILVHFGLEKGPPDKAVARLRQRAYRASKSAQSQLSNLI